MPIHGGLTPGFERYGGDIPRLKRLVDSLGSQRGTAYDSTQPSNVYIENLAIARVLDECWANNQRMANQWDPHRMTEFLSRWEAILALSPLETDTDTDRRNRIAKKFALVTTANTQQTIYDQMLALLGPTIFVGIVITPSATANVWTPFSPAWTVVAGTTNTDPTGVINFYSTIAHILIQVQHPFGMPDNIFYETLGTIYPILDTLLPAWVTWDWFQVPSGTPGFYLDSGWPGGAVPAGVTPVNLDNESLVP